MVQDAETKLRSFFLDLPSSVFDKGEIITRPLDNRQGVYYIFDGYVRMYIYFYEGREFTLNIFKPGSYFSIIALLSNLPDYSYYKAISRVKVYYAESQKILKFLQENPDVLYDLTKRLCIGFHSLIGNMSRIINGSAFERVVSILLIMGKRFSRDTADGKKRIILHLTHQDIASMANLSRETTSVELKNLENDKIISYKGGNFIINDFERLQELASNCEQNDYQGELKTL